MPDGAAPTGSRRIARAEQRPLRGVRANGQKAAFVIRYIGAQQGLDGVGGIGERVDGNDVDRTRQLRAGSGVVNVDTIPLDGQRAMDVDGLLEAVVLHMRA